MQKLVEGLHQFRTQVFRPNRELFDRLAQGQNPETLVIGCSDSRVDPLLITQAQPGDLFVLRNAGNIVPPHHASNGGEGAAIEYAVVGLEVKDILVCGHTQCGAMKGLLEPQSLETMPVVEEWLRHADRTRRILKENYAHLEGDALLTAAVEENVLAQLENLRTLPSVAARLAAGKLHLHGWVYKIETGQVFGFEPASGQFTPVG